MDELNERIILREFLREKLIAYKEARLDNEELLTGEVWAAVDMVLLIVGGYEDIMASVWKEVYGERRECDEARVSS